MTESSLEPNAFVLADCRHVVTLLDVGGRRGESPMPGAILVLDSLRAYSAGTAEEAQFLAVMLPS